MKKRMEETHTKGLAIRSDPESCVCHREGAGEALTGAHGRSIEPRKQGLRSADAVIGSGRRRYREASLGSARF